MLREEVEAHHPAAKIGEAVEPEQHERHGRDNASAPVYKIAVIQLHPEPMQQDSNHRRACAYIRQAASQGAQLTVLPEYHLLNWVPHEPDFVSECGKWAHYLQSYQALAKELHINIVPGTILELHDQGQPSQKILNAAYFISWDGEILGRYIKRHLWGPIERRYLTPDPWNETPVFDTPLGKIGMLICWDLAFPDGWREMVKQGAKIFIIPTFWTYADCSQEGLAVNPSSEALFLDSILVSRCFENTCAVVFCNAGGPPGKGYAGLSQVCVPFVGPLTKLGSCKEGMAVVDLDMKIVEDAEDNYQVRADMDGGKGWQRELQDAGVVC